jgi:hypothetical protein
MDTYTSEGDDNSATRFSDEIVEKLTISVLRFRNIGRSTSVSVDWVVLEKQRVKDSRFGQNLKMVGISTTRNSPNLILLRMYPNFFRSGTTPSNVRPP